MTNKVKVTLLKWVEIRKVSENVFDKFAIKLINFPKKNYYDSIIIAVPHKYFIKIGLKKIINFTKKNYYIFDFKNIFKNKLKYLDGEWYSVQYFYCYFI